MKTTEIEIPIGEITVKGNLTVPLDPVCFVIFSHGSGSSRFSSRNKFVAEIFLKEKIAVLLTDLLTEEEDKIFENRFNIDLLTKRLIAVTAFVRQRSDLKELPVGYFGASTGAASALQAAAELGETIQAVVSRGGRPDLAKNLSQVKAPTLLIVGSLDTDVIKLNEYAYLLLNCEKKTEIVNGATHLFEEPGALPTVAELAMGWFKTYLLNPKKIKYAVSE